MKRALAATAALALSLTLVACSGSTTDASSGAATDASSSATATRMATDMSSTMATPMDEESAPSMSSAGATAGSTSMSGTGEMGSSDGSVPAGLETATSPTYPVGTKVTITATHMDGMEGATGTVVGAYTTTVYAVDYTPTTGGAEVTDHKWVIQQEIKDAGSQDYAVGDEVTPTADHMEGMDGAKATIAEVSHETVYMVDYTPTTGGAEVKNHKWVVESELQPAA